jgi:hypothetical protein
VKPNWKQDVKPVTRQTGAQPQWKREPASPEGQPGFWTRRTKLLAGALSFLVAGVLLVAVVLWLIAPRPACLVIVYGDYVKGSDGQPNLLFAHNVFGRNGAEALKQYATDDHASYFWGSGVPHLRGEPQRLRTRADWDRDLASDFREKTLILFLALEGGADQRGAYLLPQDADTLEDKNRLYLDDVLDRLREVTANPKKNVVLILDATQAPANWSLGMLQNDFARDLRDRLDARIKDIPNLVVLSASDVGQRSWTSEEKGKSVFSDFLLEGLRGGADEGEDGNRNRRVDALELYNYTLKNVRDWVRTNRAAWQTPVLLPSGDEGKRRARNIDLAVVSDYKARAVEPTPTFRAPPELRQAWKDCRDLEQQAAPAAYAPHLWRRYLDTLLRYEQLVRIDDKDGQVELREDLERLRKLIRAARAADERTSVQNTIGMPEALGLTPPASRKELTAQLNRLWNAKDDAERKDRWDVLQREAGDKLGQQLQTLQLSALLLERVAESPRENLPRACDLLTILGLQAANSTRRSAEVHFLAMLRRDLDKKSPAPDDLIVKALKVRLLAENTAVGIKADGQGWSAQEGAAPYSEVVFRWIQKDVEKADDLRAQGQDLVLAADQASWDKARKFLDDAEALYATAQANAAEIQAGLRTCYEVRTSLPYYAHWLAERHMPPEGARPQDEEQLKLVEKIGQDNEYLTRLLEEPNPERIRTAQPLDRDDLHPKSIHDQMVMVRRDFDTLEKQFRQDCLDLAQRHASLHSLWYQIEEALLVPRIEPDLRVALLENSRQMSQSFSGQTADEKILSNIAEDDRDRADRRVKDRAQRQGRMALAALGERWVNDAFADTNNKWGVVKHLLEIFPEESREEWPISVRRAGEAVGGCWQLLPRKVDQLTLASYKAKREPAETTLAQADRLARLLDGGLVRSSLNPVQEFRNVRLHHLLLWQAERMRREHWWAEDPNADPYYRWVGQRYVKDARGLMETRTAEGDRLRPRDRLELVDQEEKALNQPGRMNLELLDPTRLEVTSERTVTLSYKLVPTGEVPAGFPVLGLEPDKLLQTEALGRKALQTNGKDSSRALDFAFTMPRDETPRRVPRIDHANAALRGVFRGQPIDLTSTLNLHRWPEIITYHQDLTGPPGLAVRADPFLQEQYGPNRGVIAIVLDCTGSMGVDLSKVRYTKNTPCKYHQATAALKELLKNRSFLGKESVVSVFVFGQAAVDANGEMLREQPENPEDTIRCLRQPIPWDPSPEAVDKLMDQIESLIPYHETPLVRAMWTANRQGFPTSYLGFKTLVVLTDGEDNRFNYTGEDPAGTGKQIRVTDPKLNPTGRKTIPEFIREEFKDTGVMVNLVGFKVDSKREKDSLTAQFKDAIEKLPLKGHFYTVDDEAQLGATLRQRMKQKLRFRLETVEGQVVNGLPDLDGCWPISDSVKNDTFIRLDHPGAYKVIVQIDKFPEQRIYVDSGDYLLINLTRDEGRGDLRFERVLYGDDFYKGRSPVEKSNWLLAVQQNVVRKDGALEMLLTLENTRDRAPRNRTLQQVRPVGLWMELETAEIKPTPPLGLRWGELAGYPAPAYAVDVAEWPVVRDSKKPARPIVRAWWNWDERQAGFADRIEKPAGADYQSAFRNQTRQLSPDAEGKVVIESIQVETRPIETRPGVVETRPCLVVRASYPRGRQPIWVELDGLRPQGWEHHFYTDACKYTGIFWTVTEEATKDLKGLLLFSVDKFKAARTTTALPGSEPETFQGRDQRPRAASEQMIP